MTEGRVNENIRYWTLALIAFHFLLYILDIPVWVAVASFSALFYRVLVEKQILKLPGLSIKLPLVIFSVVGVVIEYRTILGQEPATSLLILAVSLKVLESVRYRDVLISLLLCYYLLVGKLLLVQSFVMTLLLLVDVMLVSFVILQLHQFKSSDRSLIDMIKPISIMVLKALPFLLFLFFFFPRFSTGFFKLQVPPPPGSGFSSKLDPGDLSSLALSDRVAFRVKFLQGNPPPIGSLYWRGGILWKNSEMVWEREDQKRYPNTGLKNLLEAEPLITEVSLEPQYGQFLFALDRPYKVRFSDPKKSSRLHYRRGNSFQFPVNLSQRVLFNVESHFATRDYPLSEEERELFLQVPGPPSPRIQELLDRWMKQSEFPLQRSQFITRFFKTQGFRYTLQPGKMTQKTVDEFLFTKKVGFCEHYAAAHASLLRWMGIPSRVVIGFQGGQFNAIDNYYVVSDKDAHAWTEFWDEKQQTWIRQDPTAGVAPLRLAVGGRAFFQVSEDQRNRLTSADDFLNLQNSGLIGYLSQAKLYFDAAAHRWNLFLLKYDFNYQKKLLASIGIGNMNRWILFLLSVFLAGLFYFLWKKRFYRELWGRSKVEKIYASTCQFLARQNSTRLGYEGPQSYKKRLLMDFPGAKNEIQTFFDTYTEIRFAKSTAKIDLLQGAAVKLRKQIRRHGKLPAS